MQRSSFENKFLTKLSKIDRQEIETFLSHLVREKNFLEIIFNALVDGILVLRPSLEVMYSNDAALDLLNISSRRRIVGERVTDLCPNQQFCELVARFAIQRERMSNVEIEIDGPKLHILAVTIIPVMVNGKDGAGDVVMILHDITEARQHEEEKRRTERARAYATLAAGLAHEIKNPLNSLQIHAQLLNKALRERKPRKQENDRASQSSEIILEEIRRLERVVTDFLTAVRPTRPLVKRDSLNALAERVAATIRPEADARNIRFDVALDHDIPLVEFDPNQMNQAILNLLKNALDAVEERQQARVELRTELSDSGYCIRVSDNGRGISQEDRNKIFQPYYTTKFSGTGLGLAIVSRIVEEHGGEIDIFSEEDQGTVVSLCFPMHARPIRLLRQDGAAGLSLEQPPDSAAAQD